MEVALINVTNTMFENHSIFMEMLPEAKAASMQSHISDSFL